MARPRLDHVRKAQILHAATVVMSERGYANTRVADIAAAAGTSPAAILYWYEGKDRLLTEALRHHESEFHARYTVKAEGKASASEQLRVLVEAMLYHYDWKLWMELCVLALRDDAAAAERDRMDRRWRAAIRNVIRTGVDAGQFTVDDVDDTVFVLASLLDGIAPLLVLNAKGVTKARAERLWLREARRHLGPGFDDRPLRRTKA